MQELSIVYDPTVLHERVRAQRSRVVMGFITTGVTIVVAAGLLLYVQLARNGEAGEVLGMLIWVLSISAAIGVVVQIGRLVWLGRLRGGLRAVGEGLAFVLSSRGIAHAGGEVEWDEVSRVAAAKGKLGHGYLLRVERDNGSRLDFPLEGLSELPGSLDSATRAYSSGRHGVDLSVVDD